jgi:hypothetical protein
LTDNITQGIFNHLFCALKIFDFLVKNPLDSRTVHDNFLIYRHENLSTGLLTPKGHKYEAINITFNTHLQFRVV